MSGVVLDMDDTLYLESDYVRSGFQAVSTFLASDATSADKIYEILRTIADDKRNRGGVFDELLLRQPQLRAQTTTEQLVDMYRHHQPSIDLLPGALDLILQIKTTGLPLGMITDGPTESQKAKVTALQLTELLDPIVFTDTWGIEFRKPNERSFRHVEQAWDLPGSALVYVGDNPKKDFEGARRRGWRTARIKHPGQLHEEANAISSEASPDAEVAGFEAFLDLLRRWGLPANDGQCSDHVTNSDGS